MVTKDSHLSATSPEAFISPAWTWGNDLCCSNSLRRAKESFSKVADCDPQKHQASRQYPSELLAELTSPDKEQITTFNCISTYADAWDSLERLLSFLTLRIVPITAPTREVKKWSLELLWNMHVRSANHACGDKLSQACIRASSITTSSKLVLSPSLRGHSRYCECKTQSYTVSHVGAPKIDCRRLLHWRYDFTEMLRFWSGHLALVKDSASKWSSPLWAVAPNWASSSWLCIHPISERSHSRSSFTWDRAPTSASR